MLRLHVASEAVRFKAGDRADHACGRETIGFAQTSASIDHPDAFSLALNSLMAMGLAMLPLVLAMARLVVPIVPILRATVEHRRTAALRLSRCAGGDCHRPRHHLPPTEKRANDAARVAPARCAIPHDNAMAS